MDTGRQTLGTSERKFFDAVYSQNCPAIRAIVKRDKINPNIPDMRTAEHTTALLYACENELIDLARALLKLKPIAADVNKDNKHGRRPIWYDLFILLIIF